MGVVLLHWDGRRGDHRADQELLSKGTRLTRPPGDSGKQRYDCGSSLSAKLLEFRTPLERPWVESKLLRTHVRSFRSRFSSDSRLKVSCCGLTSAAFARVPSDSRLKVSCCGLTSAAFVRVFLPSLG